MLMERESELVRLRELCRRAATGEGAVVAIQGPPGIGKTTLVEATLSAGAQAGLLTLRASGAELERELAFGIVRQLFERRIRGLDADERASLLAGAARLAVGPLLEPEPVAPAPEAVHAAMHGLYWLAAELAARHPLLLAIDDVHWADAPSLRWLAYAARRLDGVPLLLVIAGRTAEPGTDTALLEQVLTDAEADTLRPGPLTTAGVARWLANAYGRAPAREFVEGCWKATGGNPLLLGQLVDELRAEGLATDADAAERLGGVAPATIARAVLMRLARLGPAAVTVAEAVAILSQEARLDNVAAVADMSVHEVTRWIDQLVAAGILAHGERLAFAHPVLRSAVYEQIPRARRGMAHAQAARLTLADGAGAEHAAGHLLHAPPTGDSAVVDTLRTAATSALARGAPDAAATLLQRALAEPPRERATVLLELASAESVTQDPAALEHAREVMDCAADPSERAQAALLAAHALLWVGRDDDALEILAAAERDPQALDDLTRGAVETTALMISTYSGASHLNERLTALGADEVSGDSLAERTMLSLRALWTSWSVAAPGARRSRWHDARLRTKTSHIRCTSSSRAHSYACWHSPINSTRQGTLSAPSSMGAGYAAPLLMSSTDAGSVRRSTGGRADLPTLRPMPVRRSNSPLTTPSGRSRERWHGSLRLSLNASPRQPPSR